jgi:hypothetical protein
MRKGTYLLKDKNGSATILDAIIAIGIAATFFIAFIYYTNALYTIQDEPRIDLKVKSVGIMETIINSPGQTDFLYPEWQEEAKRNNSLKAVGLGTYTTMQYGTLILNEDEVNIIDGPYPKSNSIGNDNTCFLAGTQIVMADETYKNIEDISVGDLVKSYDENKNRIEDKQVTHIFHHIPKEMGDYYLVINNKLRVTPNHQFYVEGDWIFADELKIGDSLFYPSTDYTVFSIEKKFERTYTYNFEVEGHHNYFVAMDSTDVLVHNDIVNFSVEAIPTEGSVPSTIVFHCEVTEDPIPSTLSYLFELDYGDGFTDEIPDYNESIIDICHNYTQEGVYEVIIKVTNSQNETAWCNKTVHIHPGPVAVFNWYDEDGPFLPGTNIICDASNSNFSSPSAEFQWYLDDIYQDLLSGENVSINLGNNEPHNIRLKLIDEWGNYNEHTEKVQANIYFGFPEIDSKPWILTGKDIYPDIDDDTFQPYSTGYYVKYTFPENAPQNIRIFELKVKTNTEQPVLDSQKIINLTSNDYNNSYETVKSALGLKSSKIVYNFCIEITIYDKNGEVNYNYGASYDNCIAKASTTRHVLVNFPPTAKEGDLKPTWWVIDSHPQYKQAEVTVSVFQGGTPPQ